MGMWAVDITIKHCKRDLTVAQIISFCNWINSFLTDYENEGSSRGWTFACTGKLLEMGDLGEVMVKIRLTWTKASFSEAQLTAWKAWIKTKCLDALPNGTNCTHNYEWTR